MPKHLRFAGLQKRTLRAYRKGLDRFLLFAKIEKLPLKTQKQLDCAVGEYLNALYQEGDSLAQGGHLLSGIKRFFPGMRLKLPTATQFYKNWQRIHQPERAVPISRDLMLAMAGLCITQELHLIPHRDQRRTAAIVPFAKTPNGNPQVVTCSDPRVWCLAVAVREAFEPTQLLWPSTPGQFRRFWGALLEVLDFTAQDYVPYSIRRGGATWYFLETSSMDATLQRGRWNCNRTARQYIDQGTLAMAKFLWTATQCRRVKQWALKGATQLKRLRQEKTLGHGRLGPFSFGVVCFCVVFSFSLDGPS